MMYLVHINLNVIAPSLVINLVTFFCDHTGLNSGNFNFTMCGNISKKLSETGPHTKFQVAIVFFIKIITLLWLYICCQLDSMFNYVAGRLLLGTKFNNHAHMEQAHAVWVEGGTWTSEQLARSCRPCSPRTLQFTQSCDKHQREQLHHS